MRNKTSIATEKVVYFYGNMNVYKIDKNGNETFLEMIDGNFYVSRQGVWDQDRGNFYPTSKFKCYAVDWTSATNIKHDDE